MLTNAYATIRKKVLGDLDGEGKAPWYTRWVWWVLALSIGIIVFTLWYMAKNREARNRAASITADEKARAARLKALGEKDLEKAAELEARAVASKKQADALNEKMRKSEESRKKLEASIKGAKSWEELEALEEEIG